MRTRVVEGFAPAHELIADAIPTGARVLDAGCGLGHLGERLSRRGSAVTGMEVDPGRASAAARRFTPVVVGDVETDSAWAEAGGPFDAVIFADVLEHLRDPCAALHRAAGVLSDSGRILAAIPNIAGWRGRLPILLGRFEYEESGLFDRTHVHFFTRATARELVAQAGLRVLQEHFTASQPPFPGHARRLLGDHRVDRACQRLADVWPEMFAFQVVLACEPG